MFKRAARSWLLVGAMGVTGCGTLGNLADHDKVYGGALMDADSVVTAYKDVIHRPDKPEYTYPEDLTLLLCGSIDFPFSVVGDTATLPITFTATVYHHKKELAQQAEADQLAAEPPPASAPAAPPMPEEIQGPPRPDKDEPDRKDNKDSSQTDTPDPDKKDAQGRSE